MRPTWCMPRLRNTLPSTLAAITTSTRIRVLLTSVRVSEFRLGRDGETRFESAGDTTRKLLMGSRKAVRDTGFGFRVSYAAMALEHCGCGQAQRSLLRLPSAASEQAWLQYFSPAETVQ